MEPIDKLIISKYELSEKIYKEKFKIGGDDVHRFLGYFDIMNMYSLFPRPLRFDISSAVNYNIEELKKLLYKSRGKGEDTKQVELFKESSLQFSKRLSEKISQKKTNLEDKTDSTENNCTVTTSTDTNNANSNEELTKIRYFFSYEVVDYVMANYDPEYVTNAWLKCYEILELFQMINKEEETVNYFGICEQPGAFLYCINHYIKTKLHIKDFNFIIQSLKPTGTGKIFRAENELLKEYKSNYDYGADRSGDITELENIKHYRKRYYKKKFHIITADCGLDCSDDFSAQEENLVKVILGQFLNAIGLASKGTNYFFKLFSIYEILTAEIIELARHFFKDVYITRVLKTKITSGEVYCVCKDFKFEKDEFDPILNILYSKYSNYKDGDFTIVDFHDDFLMQLIDINKILLSSRILGLNFIHFRIKNSDYVTANSTIPRYVNDLVEHYVKYFCKLYALEKLKPEDKLVEKKFISRWINTIK
jgi:hypothetical protein